VGEVAALLVAVCWSVTSVQLTLVGQRIGSQVANLARLLIAVACLAAVHLVVYGQVVPASVEPWRWWWLGPSGVIGLVMGDGFLLHAFVLIGARRSMLLMTLVPVVSTVVGWVWLGESLALVEIAAIGVAVGGIAWVVSEGHNGAGEQGPSRRDSLLGVAMGVCGAVGQALALVTAKRGMAGDFPALSATVIRMSIGAVSAWGLALAQGKLGSSLATLSDRSTWPLLVGASVAGPVIGVWLSMVAVQLAPVGIASTLMALSPIVMIPLARWIFHEPITGRSVVGTVVGLAGATVLLLG
jgi:drug/metabolite transporter (DMT)-like permease